MTPPTVLRISEAEWQAQVVELATMLGYRCLHVRRSIGGTKQGWRTTTSIVGWVDLFCYHPKGGAAALELKVGKNKTTPEQDQCIADLAGAGIPTMVAYPSDIAAVRDFLVAARRPK